MTQTVLTVSWQYNDCSDVARQFVNPGDTDGELRQAIPVLRVIVDFLNKADSRKFDLFEDHLTTYLKLLQGFKEARKEHRSEAKVGV